MFIPNHQKTKTPRSSTASGNAAQDNKEKRGAGVAGGSVTPGLATAHTRLSLIPKKKWRAEAHTL